MLKKILKVTAFVVVALSTLLAVFYTEENWRGKRAWGNCKRDLEAKGAILDWDKLIPPPVPDEQNFFKAPKMAEWFVKISGVLSTNELVRRLQSTNTALTSSVSIDSSSNLITTAAMAREYLAWSDQFGSDFELIRTALKRPCARMDGDYTRPFEMPIPNFITVRIVAQTLAQRAHCYLLLNQPEKALSELTLLNDSRRLLLGAPTSQPMTLVAAMINVAVAGVYVKTVAEGLQCQVWQSQELIRLQEQLAGINLTPFVLYAFECEPVAVCRGCENADPKKLTVMVSVAGKSQSKSVWEKITDLRWNLMPRGWIYQNLTLIARLGYKRVEGFDLVNNLIRPNLFENLARETEVLFSDPAKPYSFLADLLLPNSTKAVMRMARNQTCVNETQIVCALERHRFAHGVYPVTLDALVPQFIAKLPHDLIGGKPLHYRRAEDGTFLLYSIGWDEKDDGGSVATLPCGTQVDWVWNPTSFP